MAGVPGLLGYVRSLRTSLRAFLRVHVETKALFDGAAKAFLPAGFREISLRSARVWL